MKYDKTRFSRIMKRFYLSILKNYNEVLLWFIFFLIFFYVDILVVDVIKNLFFDGVSFGVK